MRLVAAGDGAIVGSSLASGQIVLARPIVEAPIDASQITCGREALQVLVDGSAAAEVGKVGGCPDFIRVVGQPGE